MNTFLALFCLYLATVYAAYVPYMESKALNPSKGRVIWALLHSIVLCIAAYRLADLS